MTEKRPDGGPSGRSRLTKWALAGHDLERAVIVAVAAMRMMQVAGDQVVDVVTMRHGFMAAARTVLVARLVAAAGVVRRASVGIGGTHLDRVLVEVIAMRVMQVAGGRRPRLRSERSSQRH